jgi:hypothetical protein
LLKWGLSGRGSNLLKSDRPLMSSTPRVDTAHRFSGHGARARRAREVCEEEDPPN